MSIKFNGSIKKLMLGRGIKDGFASTFSISVYSGTLPTPAEVTAAWSSYNSTVANFLAHYLAAAWTQPNNGPLLQLTKPPAVNALRNGTGTWAILWDKDITAPQVAGSTLPSDSFMIVSVSNILNLGVIRFTDPVFASGVSKAIFEGSISATSY